MAASRHSPQNRQKIDSNGITEIMICETAAKTAAEPSIRADTLAIFFFPACQPRSIVMAVPMILQGPPIMSPIKSRDTQQVQAVLSRAKETMNMTTAERVRKGVRKRARQEQISPRQPTPMPPIKEPRSTIAAMQPFSLTSPLLSRQVGSQKSSPQMHPLVQAQPITQKGTLGRKSAVNTLISFSSFSLSMLTYLTCQVKMMLLLCYSSPYSSGFQVNCDIYSSWFFFYFGFYCRKIRQITPIATVRPPVTRKLEVQGSPCDWSSILHNTSAMMLPTLELMPQKPMSSPLLPLPNQLPTMPMTPGQPVLWKKPLRHMATTMRTQLKEWVMRQAKEQDIQKKAESSMPTATKYLRLTLELKLPMVAMPMEQAKRQRVSTRPNCGDVMSNSVCSCFFEYDQPSRRQWRPAQAKNVRLNTMNFWNFDDIGGSGIFILLCWAWNLFRLLIETLYCGPDHYIY